MIPHQNPDPTTVQAVVLYDGHLLLVSGTDGWTLPAGAPEQAESPEAAAARIVYELTSYLVDGSQPLEPADGDRIAVVCQLLSEAPSAGGRLPSEDQRWVHAAEADSLPLPPAVAEYLRGHTPA